MQKRTAYCENPICSLAVLSVMGDRTDQQDDFGYMLDDERSLIIVCDGMGGHEEAVGEQCGGEQIYITI